MSGARRQERDESAPGKPYSYGIAPDGTPWRSFSHAQKRMGLKGKKFWEAHRKGEIGLILEPHPGKLLISEGSIQAFIESHTVRPVKTANPRPWANRRGPNGRPGLRGSA